MNMNFHSMTNIDGEILATDRARIPVMDRGFLYGDSVYEVFRTYSGIPLFFDEHWSRLLNSAALIRMELSLSKPTLKDEIYRTIRASGASDLNQDVYARYAITRGEGPVDLFPDPDLQQRYVITVKELPQWNARFRDPGVTLALTSVRRNPSNALDPEIKGGNYLNNVLATLEARAAGADDGLMLNQQGLVTEASNSNVFFVLDGELVTPSPASGLLNGLTKQAVQESCAKGGIRITERDIEATELGGASECFLTSATREVMPVSRLRLEDGATVSFPAGGGEVTRAVHRFYREYVSDYVELHANESVFRSSQEARRNMRPE